jgi:hypothetical protein
MTRLLSLLVILAVVGLTYLFVHYYQDSYELIPVTQEVNPAKAPIKPWVDFRSPSGKFQVKFPSAPQHAKEKLVDPHTKEAREYDMYAAESGLGSVYMISLITFDEVDTPDEETDLLTSVMNNMVNSSKNNVLKTMDMGSFQNQRALNFSIENGDVQIQATAFIRDKILYALTCVSKKISGMPTEFNYFLNSFKLISEENSPNNVK